jgi:hypothetical protein
MIGYRGWFYHFLDMDTSLRTWKCELSSIDTALFLAGALYTREYFSSVHLDEVAIRDLVNQIYNRIDWHWMAAGASGDLARGPTPNPSEPPSRRSGAMARREGGEGNRNADSRRQLTPSGAATFQTLSMGWRPENGFIKNRWVGYNEGMILYLLGLGSSTNALPSESWREWTRGYEWKTSYGQSFIHFAPLFGHQYSHCWIDFRGMADDYMRRKGIDYFENSRRATLAQHAYCVANPGKFKGYGELVWGLTACDGPGFGKFQAYAARGAPPPEHDDGTIAPTATGGSVPFAPEICIRTLRYFYEHYRPNILTRYGFCDAFNLTAGWWDSEVLGIDQGPILIMIENYRSGRVWKTFMKAIEIQRGLKAAGFRRVER